MVTETQTASEVLIEGTLYDVSKFRHPGGSIIKFMQGSGDATEAFREFHSRSSKATKYLATLPNRPAPKESAKSKAVWASARWKAMTQDFAKLRQQLVEEGWFNPSPLHVVYRISEIVVMHVLGIYLLLATSYWIPALFILGLAQGRCGWLMHEGGHHSLTGNIKIDHRLQEVLYGVGAGMSAAWWRNQHNKHHATPQKLQHDVDLDTLPLVAFNSAIAKLAKNSAIVRGWLSIQAYTFPPITCSLVAAFWQFFLHPRHIFRTRRYVEALCLVARYTLITAIAQAAGVTFATAVGAYLIYNFFGGAYIFMNFALSHTHLDVTAKDEHVHWLEYAATYTINITPNLATNWWMAYLNFQIEHHLFPSMPQYRFVKLAPRIKELFKRHGLKYDVRDYFSAMHDTLLNLDNVGHAI